MSLITYVTRIHFADQVLEPALDAELDAMNVLRPLVLLDGDGSREGVLARLKRAFPRHVEPELLIFDQASADEAACNAAAEAFAAGDCDALIAFGGATAVNLAKVAAIRVSHKGPLRRYVGSEGGTARIRDVLPPLLAIPTVAGTGTELASAAVIATESGPNIALVSPHLVPRVVVYDPTLTLDLAAERTASAGMDALAHCVETFTASAFNPPADGIALDGLRRAFENLERAVADGSDLEARREMMAAALNGALAQQKGLGGVHAMSHALGGLGVGRLDHGAVKAVLLPFVLAFNEPAAGRRYAEIRRELALPPGADLGEAMAALRGRLGLPARLSDLGVGDDNLGDAAAYAACDYANRTNPRKANAVDYLELLRAAL